MNSHFPGKQQQLRQRLAEIAESLKQHPYGLGLLGLGSAGQQNRLDDYSDLDFFAIVTAGHKMDFINDLNWLATIAPISYCFRNTHDGYKLLFGDGIFCEFAVFEPQELPMIPFEQGLFVWRDESLPPSLATPAQAPPAQSTSLEFLLGELLTNLYVGLCRYHRGEVCSALRFIQVYAVDRLITLLDLDKANLLRDPFCVDRRAELRHPEHAALFEHCLQGAAALPASARVMLDFVEQRYDVNQAMAAEIRTLC